MARERELVVVLRGVDAHRMRLEHALPEVRDLAGGAVPVAGRRDVHDRTLEQVDPRGGEPMRVRARERVAAGEAGPYAQPVRPSDDRPLHGAYVGDQRAGADVWLEADEQLEVGGGRRGEHQQLDGACHVHGAGRRVVDRALARRRDPLGGLGRPAEHGRDPSALRLEGERAADRTEADDAERVGSHGMETSPTPRSRKRRGRPGSEPPSRRAKTSSPYSGSGLLAFTAAPGVGTRLGRNGVVTNPLTRGAPRATPHVTPALLAIGVVANGVKTVARTPTGTFSGPARSEE